MGDAYVAPRDVIRLTADWPGNHPSHPKAGDLVVRHRLDPNRLWSRMDGHGGAQATIDALEYEAYPALTWRDFQAMLDFYLSGRAVLPNLKAMEVEDGLSTIASAASMICRQWISTVRLPGFKSNWGTWARTFLGTTQGGVLDGTGVLIAYRRYMQPGPQIFRFALCEHRKQVGPGANPMRGWHPGHCIRCGLNMSVDSSD